MDSTNFCCVYKFSLYIKGQIIVYAMDKFCWDKLFFNSNICTHRLLKISIIYLKVEIKKDSNTTASK